nr:hypothetical protein [Tanacetum cinerariifolium]
MQPGMATIAIPQEQVKFVTCTLQDDALTWWNSYVKTTTPEAAHAMTGATLKKKMTDKYFPRGEIKKIEAEMWNLKIDKIEKYIGGLPDMILGSVKASKSKTMQEVIEFTTELMEDKTKAYVERQANNKRKSEDIARNNQNQQPNKRQNIGQAYTAGNGDKKLYAGSRPPCSKCNYNHEEDQPLPADASPTALSPGYVIDSDPKEDEEDPKEDPANYPANGGDNDDDESSDDDDDDDDVEKEKEEHLAPADPFAVSTNDHAENKRKLDNTSKNNQNQQQPNKRQNTGRAYTAWHGEKKHYSGSKPLCSKCNYHHYDPYAPECHKCNRVGHLTRDCRSSTNANTTNIQKGTEASQKATCYECGNQGHYRRDCPERKNQNHEKKIESTEACGVVHAFGGGETEQDLNNIKDENEA